MRHIVLLGAGAHAGLLIKTARLAGLGIPGVYDDDPALWGTTISGVPVRGPLAQAEHAGLPAVIAMADPRRREAIAQQFSLSWAQIIHPRAVIDRFVTIRPGTVVLAGAVVQPGATIGAHVVVGPKATIAHDCEVSDFVQFGSSVQLAGTVFVGRGATLDSGAVAIPNVRLGAGCYVGPASVVIHPVADHAHVAGVPARVIAPAIAPLAEAVVELHGTQPT